MKLRLGLLSIVILVIATFLVGVAYFPKNNQSSQLNSSTTPMNTPSQDAKFDAAVNAMSLNDKILSLLILHPPGTDSNQLKNFVSTYHPGGVILMGDNIPSDLSQLKDITSGLQNVAGSYPLLIATDEEGCTVKRIPSDNLPCAPDLQEASPSSTTQAFQQRSVMLKNLGINLNFGIIADVTSNPNAFIYPRVFGGDPDQVGERVAAAVEGSKNGTFSTLKHFPGHGETIDDSHTLIPLVSISKDQWEQKDAVPFISGINAGADFIMFGHLTYQSVDTKPASLSLKWHQILTDELHFQGIMITDDMIMLQESGLPEYQDVVTNAVEALNAGNTMLLYVNSFNTSQQPGYIDIEKLVNGIAAAVQEGKLPESTINADVKKVLLMREKTKSFSE